MARKLEKDQWQSYFERVSKALGANVVEIAIVGPRLGAQRETRGTTLTGVSYDPKGDLFAAIGEDLEHNIRHPREIYVDGEVEGLRSFEVVDAEAVRHIFTFKEVLRLAPPAR
ncbi:MAG: DUF5335 family protein [Burkholderiales bacterium]|nr:DUF5335 family protein [Burkholderiales bacterium]